MTGVYVLKLTPSQRMALLDLITTSLTDPHSREVYVDVANNVETTPGELIQLLMHADFEAAK